MKKDKVRKIAKPIIVLILVGLILFFLFDSILMPLYVQKGMTTNVPNVVGLPLDNAKEKIKEAGLEPKEAEYKSDKRYKIGTVTLQNPIAESEVKRGRGVYLTISGGEELVDVPNLRGKSIREAEFNLEKNNLKLGTITYETSEEVFANTIIRQEIQPGSKLRSGNQINVVVSQGRSSDKHLVPDVTLKTINEAEKILNDNGFRIGKTTYQVNIDVLPNTVLEQYPRAGELFQLGQLIDLTLAQKTDTKNKTEN